MSEGLEKTLTDWLSGLERLVIVGVGNPLRCDDKLGLAIVRRLKGGVDHHVCLIEAGTVPESYTGLIVGFKPSHILLIDAAQLDREPGFARLVLPNEIDKIAITTHILPLSLLTKYLSNLTGANIALLGVQPKCLNLAEGSSEEVRRAVVKISELLLKLLNG